MKEGPILERLAAAGFVTLGGALDYAALKTAPGRLPAGYFVPMGETGGANRNDTGIAQRVEVEWMIVLILDSAARSNAKLVEHLETMTVAVKDRLVGWKHPEASGPTLYAGGRLLGLEAGHLEWGLRLRSAYQLRTA